MLSWWHRCWDGQCPKLQVPLYQYFLHLLISKEMTSQLSCSFRKARIVVTVVSDFIPGPVEAASFLCLPLLHQWDLLRSGHSSFQVRQWLLSLWEWVRLHRGVAAAVLKKFKKWMRGCPTLPPPHTPSPELALPLWWLTFTSALCAWCHLCGQHWQGLIFILEKT